MEHRAALAVAAHGRGAGTMTGHAWGEIKAVLADVLDADPTTRPAVLDRLLAVARQDLSPPFSAGFKIACSLSIAAFQRRWTVRTVQRNNSATSG